MLNSFELQPTLVGQTLTLRPLVAADLEALVAAASDPLIWQQHPEPQRCEREFFSNGFFAGALGSGSALTVIENSSGEVVGSSRYYDWNPEAHEIAIGYTFLIRRLWGGASNAELKALMLDHAFRWASRVWFHIGPDNWRSRRAVEKLGGKFSHEEQQAGNRSRVWYSLDKPINAARS